MRGLTSHARHMHDMDKEEIYSNLFPEEKSKSGIWKIVAGLGTIFFAIITAGKNS